MQSRLFSEISPSNISNNRIIIIGAGLAGLSAAIRILQKSPSNKVLILEKRAQSGGPCELVNIDGHDFELSTQMGAGALKLLQELDIDIKVENISNELSYSDGTLITTPFNKQSIWNLLYPISIAKLILRMAVSEDSEQFSNLLLGLDLRFGQEILAMFAYPSAKPKITLGRVRQFFKDPHGHSSPIIAKNGIWDIIKKMEDKIRKLGGIIKFNQECVEVIKLTNGQQLVKTKNRQYKANLVLSSSAWDTYPPTAIKGLPLISIFCEMDSSYKHPADIHTTAFFPDKIPELFEKLTVGSKLPEKPAFHCFPNKLPGKQKAITIFITTPYGTGEVSTAIKKNITEYVLNRVAKRFPDFRKNLKKTHCLSPKEFEEKFHLLSHAPTKIAPKGFIPPARDSKTGVYFIGDAVCPLSPNIFGAISSAKKRVEEIFEKSNKQEYNPFIRSRL